MSEPRFWEEGYVPDDETPTDPADAGSTAADNDAPTGFSKDAPVKPGGVSAVDPETGEWKPTRLIKEAELGGHQFRWMEGPIAEARITDEHGTLIGTVQVPFDPADGEPGDDELADAMQVWNSLEYIRGIVRQDAIDGMVSDLITHKVEGDRSVAEIMVATVTEAIAEGSRIEVTDDDGDLTPEQLEALQVEVNRLFAEKMPVFVQEIANIQNPGVGDLTFWQQMAQDTIAHALMYARDAAAEEYGGLEAAAALEGTEGDAFEQRVDELYKTGPFLMGSYMTAWRGWMPILGEMARTGIEYASEKPTDDPSSLGARILRKARENLGLPDMPETGKGGLQSPAHMALAFTAEGLGRTGNDLVSRATQLALVSQWVGVPTIKPVFSHQTDRGTVTYEVDTHSLQEAWELVARLGDGHVDVFDYIVAKMLASMADGARTAYGDFVVTPQELCDMRGHKKHHKGGHQPKNLQEVIGQVDDLKHLKLQAIIQETREQGKGKKPPTLIHTVDLIAIHETLEQMQTNGEKTIIGWALRPGNWARELELFSKQYAVTMRGILMLHSGREKHAKRIGRYLVGQYRNNANKRPGPLVRKVRTILQGAGIPLPDRNKPRFRDSIEAALNTLADPEKMRGPVCVERWEYQTPIDYSDPKWYEHWLDSNIVIVIPPLIAQERYREIARKGERSRALKAGNRPHKPQAPPA